MAEPTARQLARNWWNATLENAEAVDVKKLAVRAAAELVADPWFRETFLEDFVGSALYDMGLRMLANQRAELRTREGVLRQLAKDEAKIDWTLWREWDPSTGTHVPLPQMTREQLIAAAEYRVTKAEQLKADALWLETMATFLAPGVTLGSVLSSDDITFIRKNTVPARHT